MPHCERHKVTLTTDAAGACTAFTDQMVNGAVLAVCYNRGTLDATTTDITITTELSLQTVLTLTNVTATTNYMPRTVNNGSTGTALAGVEPIYAANERLKVVVAQGGNTLTGSITFIVG